MPKKLTNLIIKCPSLLDDLMSDGENKIWIIMTERIAFINLDGVFYLPHFTPGPPWPNAESTKLRIKWMSASWMHDSKLGKGILKRLLKSFFSLFFFSGLTMDIVEKPWFYFEHRNWIKTSKVFRLMHVYKNLLFNSNR